MFIAVSDPNDHESKFLRSIDELLTAGADPNIQDKRAKTALIYLVENDNTEGVKRLLKEKNIDLFKKDEDGETARQILAKKVMHAKKEKESKSLRETLKLLSDYRQTTLQKKPQFHTQREVIKMINEFLDDIGALGVDQYKEKAALEEKAVQTITDFTKKGEDLVSGEQDAELLLQTIQAESPAIFKALVMRGKLDPNRARYGITPLNRAIMTGNADIACFLIPKIDKSTLDTPFKDDFAPLVRTVIHAQIQLNEIKTRPHAIMKYQNSLQILNCLLSAGADQSVLDKYTDPESEFYKKDIAIYVKEFNREQQRYMQADLKK